MQPCIDLKYNQAPIFNLGIQLLVGDESNVNRIQGI
jgi:hypothetical protein